MIMTPSGADNPLLKIEFQVPFNRIGAGEVQPAVRTLLDGARAAVEAIAAQPGERTFANTMRELDTVASGWITPWR